MLLPARVLIEENKETRCKKWKVFWNLQCGAEARLVKNVWYPYGL